MATVGTTSRPAYVYDQETDTWVPVGVGPHTHDNFVTATTIDAKGDLLAGSAPDTVGRLPIGANGTLLVADSTETLGMAWRSILTLTAPTSSTVPLTVKGATSQSANLFNVTDSSNNILASILSNGRLEWNTAGTFLAVGTAYRSGAGASFTLRRSKSDTFGVNVALANGDNVGNFQTFAADGTGFNQVTSLSFDIDGTVGTSTTPGRMIFSTASSTPGGAIERMRIDSTGRIKIPEGGVLEAPLFTNWQNASSTLVLADAGRLVEMQVSSSNTLTVPPNSSVPFPIGTQIHILQVGTGQTTIVAGSGVTINATPGLKLRAQWSSAMLIKRSVGGGLDTWVLVGDLAP